MESEAVSTLLRLSWSSLVLCKCIAVAITGYLLNFTRIAEFGRQQSQSGRNHAMQEPQCIAK